MIEVLWMLEETTGGYKGCTAAWINPCFLCVYACLPVEFRECLWGRPAEPPVCVGADEPRAADPYGRAFSSLSRPKVSAQSSEPAGEVSADGPCAAGPPPHQVYTNPQSHKPTTGAEIQDKDFYRSLSEINNLSICALMSLFSFLRQKISKEEIPEVSGTIRDLEAEWDRKWMDTLNETPLVSFLNEDPVSGEPN